jgi:Transglutaminase-like superfamily
MRPLRLSPSDRHLLIEAVVLVAAIRLGLWLLPFRSVRTLVERLGAWEWGAAPEGDSASIKRIAWAVTRASRYLPAATCLTQALAAQVLLRRRGLAAKLHLGVGRDEDERFVAHAWVESQGRIVVGGSNLDRYTRLAVLEGDNP